MPSNLHSAEVNQAAGMVSVQAGISIDGAFDLMEITAEATGETLDEVAARILGGDLRFEDRFD
jgi:AmiR/NasT family two-component response regulator